MISLKHALSHVLLLITALSIVPSVAIAVCLPQGDINGDGNVNVGDLLLLERQILRLGTDTDGDGYVEGIDCDESNADVYPGATEVCDGVDNNCDCTVDEGCSDNDGDGYAMGVDCDDTNGDVYPGATEVCDGLDNDCDGIVDDGNPGGGGACSTGQLGVCAAGTTTCQSGVLSCTQDVFPTAEVCDGLDNDCDGVVDDGCG
jgi:hypothetical protein